MPFKDPKAKQAWRRENIEIIREQKRAWRLRKGIKPRPPSKPKEKSEWKILKEQGLRKCSRCLSVLTIKEFKPGRGRCSPCIVIEDKERVQRGMQDPTFVLKQRVKWIRKRDKKHGLQCEMTHEDVALVFKLFNNKCFN